MTMHDIVAQILILGAVLAVLVWLMMWPRSPKKVNRCGW
jgi:hypothetical protein